MLIHILKRSTKYVYVYFLKPYFNLTGEPMFYIIFISSNGPKIFP